MTSIRVVGYGRSDDMGGNLRADLLLKGDRIHRAAAAAHSVRFAVRLPSEVVPFGVQLLVNVSTGI